MSPAAVLWGHRDCYLFCHNQYHHNTFFGEYLRNGLTHEIQILYVDTYRNFPLLSYSAIPSNTILIYCVNTSYPMDNCFTGWCDRACQMTEKSILCL